MRSNKPSVVLITAGMLLATVMSQRALAAQKPDYPKVTAEYRQSAEEQQKDVSECYEIAKTRTGIDPSTLSRSESTKPDTSDTQKATGSVQNAPPEADSAASAPADHPASSARKEEPIDTFRRANEACLRARGYMVNSNKTTKEGPPSPEKP